jgi:putative ABC transport system permease protein
LDDRRRQAGVTIVGTVLRRHLGRHPWLVVLAVLGIALGVAMSTAIDLAIASSRRAFAESTAAVTGRATHQIVAGPSGIPDAEVACLRAELAPDQLAPVVESDVALPEHPGRVLRLTGVDPLSEPPFRPYLGSLTSGDAAALAALMTRPATIALLRATADELGLSVGSRLALLIGTRTVTVEVAALLDPGDGFSRRALADVAACDIATAQELLGRAGVIDRIDLIAREGEDLSRVQLPAGASLAPAASRAQALDQMTRAFHLNLTALGLIALVVGMFLIHNTAGFLVVQRREAIARLRLAGATRGAIAGAILAEAATFGVVGSALGLALGIVAAQALVGAVTRTISDLYFVVSVREAALPGATLALNAAVGVAVTVAAAAMPAWEATRTRPAAVLAPSAHAERARRAAPWLAAAGFGCGALAAALIAIGGPGLVAGFAALGLVIAAWAMLVPWLLGLGAAALAPALSRALGPIAAMAARSVRATLGRTGVAVAALAVASAASLGVGVMVGSFRAALVDWLDSTLRADVYISAPRSVAAKINEVPLAPDLVRRLAAAPGVMAFTTKRDAHPMSAAGRLDLVAFDMPPEVRRAFTFTVGQPAAAWAAFADGAALVTEPFAFRHDVRPGSTLRILTDRGEREFPIAGVVKDYSNDQGAVFLERRTYERWWDDRGVSGVSAFAAPGVSADQLMANLRAAAGADALQMSSNRDLRRESLEVFDRTFAVTRVIRILAGAVAFLGVLSALMALALERAREVAMLRMHGCTPRQVAALLGGQAAITGAAAGLLALPLGIALAAVLALVINRRSFGWTFDLRVDWADPAQAVALAIAAALLAAIYPAWKMSRLPPAAALRGD